MLLVRSAVLLVFILIQTAFPAISTATLTQTDYWPLKDVDAFFKDPLVNFDKLKNLNGLKEKISLYIRWNWSVVEDSFKTHFQDIDDRKIEIVMFLLSHYPHYPITDEAARIFGLHPALFARALEKTNDWEVIIGEVSKSWEAFALGLAKLGNTEFENEIREYALSLNQERERKLRVAAAFVHDPVANYEKIKTIENIGGWISKYERQLDQEGRVNELPIRTLLENLYDIDEKKMEILMYLIINVHSGYQAELVMDKAADVFKNHPQLFLCILKRTNEWKSVISDIASWDPEAFKEGMEKAGDSEFVKQIKKYLAEAKRKLRNKIDS